MKAVLSLIMCRQESECFPAGFDAVLRTLLRASGNAPSRKRDVDFFGPDAKVTSVWVPMVPEVAAVAELADAQASGACARKGVKVRVLSAAVTVRGGSKDREEFSRGAPLTPQLPAAKPENYPVRCASG